MQTNWHDDLCSIVANWVDEAIVWIDVVWQFYLEPIGASSK